MPKIIIGIDPGKNGGIAVMNTSNNSVMVKKMPETPKDVIDLLKKFAKQDVVCVLETVGGMPGQGGKAMFTFGRGYGSLETALLLLEIKTYPITPQKWQKEFQLGTTKSSGGFTTTQWKNILKAKAQQLFPKNKIFNWGADALLIAEFGFRTYK